MHSDSLHSCSQWACSARAAHAGTGLKDISSFSLAVGSLVLAASLVFAAPLAEPGERGWLNVAETALRVRTRTRTRARRAEPWGVPVNAWPTLLSLTTTEPKKSRGACGGLNGSTQTACELVGTWSVNLIVR